MSTLCSNLNVLSNISLNWWRRLFQSCDTVRTFWNSARHIECSSCPASSPGFEMALLEFSLLSFALLLLLFLVMTFIRCLISEWLTTITVIWVIKNFLRYSCCLFCNLYLLSFANAVLYLHLLHLKLPLITLLSVNLTIFSHCIFFPLSSHCSWETLSAPFCPMEYLAAIIYIFLPFAILFPQLFVKVIFRQHPVFLNLFFFEMNFGHGLLYRTNLCP